MIQKKQKVCITCGIDTTVQVLLAAQIEAMQKQGLEVHVVCSPGANRKWYADRGIVKHDIQINRFVSPFRDLITLWKLYRCFRRERFTVVHTHTVKDGLLGQIAAKLAGVPISISTLHGFYFNENMTPWIRRFYTLIDGAIIRLSTVVLSQNSEEVEKAITMGMCKRDKIKFLGNGVDLSIFTPACFDTDARGRKRSEIGLPGDAIVVGIIGRLVQEKGYLELFEAMSAVMEENDHVWLVIIGSEELEKTDRISSDAFEAYGISKRTRFLGQREDIPELLACCDIYALPSWREGFPRSAIEAAAMALPIVTTNISGCRQVVEDGVNGLLVPLRNPVKLKEMIIKLTGDERLRCKLGQAGFEKARREFDENRVCGIVVNTYDELLKGIRPK